MADNRFKYKVVADDQSEKGVKSAAKRLGTLEKAAKRYSGTLGKASRKSPLAHATSSFAKAHASTYKALGGSSSPLKAVAERLGAISEASSTAKAGMAAATEGAGLLGGSLSALGVAAGGTLGVLVAAGVAAVKIGSSWAEGGAQLGRLSQSLGMATDDLQKFQNAGAQFGVDKSSMAGAIGGVGSTVHEAVYGRNNEALAAMNQLGIGIARDKDGKVDESEMMKRIADAVARQTDPYTQQRIAGIFGVSSALPLLRQGRAGMEKAMDEGGKYGPMYRASDITPATETYQNDVRVGQMKDRGVLESMRSIGLPYGSAAAAAVQVGHAAIDRGGDLVAALGRTAAEGARAAIGGLGSAAKQTGDQVSRLGGAVGSLAYRIEHLGERSRQDQVSPKGATGVMQVMPETARETAARHGIPWDEDRYHKDAAYSRQLGDAYLSDRLGEYDGDEVLAAASYNAGPGNVNKWIKRFGDPRRGQISDAEFARDIPVKETHDYVQRVVANPSENRIVLEVHGLPAGTKAVARAKDGGGVTVAYAMAGSGP